LQAIETRIRSLERVELPVAGSGGFLTGSGVANEVAFFSGVATLASSPLIARAASGNILTLTAGAATDIPLTIMAHASQSANVLNLKTSGGTIFTSISAVGAALFQNSSNSTTGFSVLNAAGSTIFNVDTTNLIVGIFSKIFEAVFAILSFFSEIFSRLCRVILLILVIPVILSFLYFHRGEHLKLSNQIQH